MQRDRAQPGSFLGIGGLAVAAFLYGYAAIALPSVLHSVVMPVWWLLLFVLACVWFTPHPRRTAGLAVVAVVTWFVVLLAVG